MLAADRLEQEQPSVAEGLRKLLEAVPSSSKDLPSRILEETEKSKARLEERRWKLILAEKEILLYNQFNKIIKFVQAFKDVTTSAAGLDPVHAGLPLAGLFLLMQFVVADTDQYTSMVAGVEEVSWVINRYKYVESVFAETGFTRDFEQLLITLYVSVLKYQVLAASYYRRNSGMRFLRSIPKLDDLSETLADIRRHDEACTALGRIFDVKEGQLRHREIRSILLDFDKKMELGLAEVTRELRNTAIPDPSKSAGLPEVPFPFAPDPKFTGRETVIADLDAGFGNFRRMALVGWAGVGKSQVAIEYAHRVRKSRPSTRIYWVRGARRDTFINSYQSLAGQLKLPGHDQPSENEENVAQLFYEMLHDPINGDWLMILDSADDETILFTPSQSQQQNQGRNESTLKPLLQYLPSVPHGSILITSRNRAAASQIVNEDDCILLVDRFDDDDALALLRKKLPRDDSPRYDAVQLVSLLYHLPLAITQASTYISRLAGRMTISKYRDILISDPIRCMEFEANDIRRDGGQSEQDFSNSVLKTWQISFDYISEHAEGAGRLLCLMSLLHIQCIPVDYLFQDEDSTAYQFEETIGPLVEFNLISADAGGVTYSMHQLIQLSIVYWMKRNDILQEAKGEVLALLEDKTRYSTCPWTMLEVLVPHIDTVLQYQSSHEDLIEIALSLLINVEQHYFSQGLWRMALSRAKKAYNLPARASGVMAWPERRFLAGLMILQISIILEKFVQAEDHALALAEKAILLLPMDDETTMLVLDKSAQVLLGSGKIEKGIELAERAFQSKEQHLGLDNESTIRSFIILANLLVKQDRLDEARQRLTAIESKCNDLYGPMHQSTLMTKACLAGKWLLLGCNDQAEMLLHDIYRAQKQKFDDRHQNTMSALGDYVRVLVEQNKLDEARHWNNQFVQLAESQYHANNDNLLFLNYSRAYCYKADIQARQNNVDDTIIAKLESIIKEHRSRVGTKHTATLNAMALRGRLQLVTGQNEGAIETFLSVIYALKSLPHLEESVLLHCIAELKNACLKQKCELDLIRSNSKSPQDSRSPSAHVITIIPWLDICNGPASPELVSSTSFAMLRTSDAKWHIFA